MTKLAYPLAAMFALSLCETGLVEIGQRGQRLAVSGVLAFTRCPCGCGMTVAECRRKLPSCASSRRLTAVALGVAAAGGSAQAVLTALDTALSGPKADLGPAVRLDVGDSPWEGPKDARVTIVEFADFQCPYCAGVTEDIEKLLQDLPGVRFAFKQFPLESHPYAKLAAEASLAAKAQGKFWQMYELLYDHFDQLSPDTIAKLAAEARLDLARLQSDLDSHRFAEQVEREKRDGEQAGVQGTPTFFINGRKLNLAFDLAAVEPLVSRELERTREEGSPVIPERRAGRY